MTKPTAPSAARGPATLTISLAARLPPAGTRDALAVCVNNSGPDLAAAPARARDALAPLLGEIIRDFKPSEGDTLDAFVNDPRGLSESADDSTAVVKKIGDASAGDDAAKDASAGDSDAAARAGARRLLLVGVGEFEDDEDVAAASVRRAAATAVRRARETRVETLSFVLPSRGCDTLRAARAAAEGACLGCYENNFYQAAEDEDERPRLAEFRILCAAAEGEDAARLRASVERGRVVAESANWARSLADLPGASLPPRELARRAAEMAAEFGLTCEVIGGEEIRARGMGGLWGVGQGSDEPPALIVVRYEPGGAHEPDGAAGANVETTDGADSHDHEATSNDEATNAVEATNAGEAKNADGATSAGEAASADGGSGALAVESADGGGELLAFVGKGITFDTGGISIKPAEHMEEMKSDMAGGAAALGALRALAQLKARCRAVAVVPAAENMPSGRSLKPGDVVRTLAGRTIEVVDTDAEGRLVLVDGLAYAQSLGATRIVDLATLTGSVVVALGDHRAGLFSNDDDWAARVTRAARRAGEPVWRLPVSDDYKKKIESDIADFKNYGGRPDATAAALLLSKFAAPLPWAHLDIAATAWLEDPQPHAPAGATGTGVRTLVELALATDDEGAQATNDDD